MTKYRLNKAETATLTLYNVAITKEINGRSIVTYSNYMRLAPRAEYETDDTALIAYLKAYRRKERYNKQLEDALKEHNVPYEIEYCKSCGGRIKKISYNPIEVLA